MTTRGCSELVQLLTGLVEDACAGGWLGSLGSYLSS